MWHLPSVAVQASDYTALRRILSVSWVGWLWYCVGWCGHVVACWVCCVVLCLRVRVVRDAFYFLFFCFFVVFVAFGWLVGWLVSFSFTYLYIWLVN